MRKFLLAILLLLALPGARAESVDSLFVHAPADVLPLLSRNVRLNLMDYYDHWGAANTSNELNGNTTLVAKDSVMLCLQPTEASEWTMVKADSTTLICIHTLQLPAADSRITVYDMHWEPKPCTLPALTISNFRHDTDSLSIERRYELDSHLRPLHIRWTAEADGKTFYAAVSTEGTTEADAAELRKTLYCLRFEWNGTTLEQKGKELGGFPTPPYARQDPIE